MSPFSLLLFAAPVPVVAAGNEPIDDPAFALPIDPPQAPAPRNMTLERAPQRLGAKILFVNFDGGQLNGGCGNDPHNDCSQIFNGTVLPYSGDEAKRASVIQVIRSRVEDFGITITNLRPDSGDYDMEMVGNWQGEMPGFAGVAPNIDCWDADGGEVSFTLESAASADGIAEIVLQEAAHTWGLEHVNVQTDLLFPTTSGSNKTFNDDCAKIVSDTMLNESDGYCNQVHTNFCNSGWQNSYQELLMVFGESTPDTIAPTVEIVSPADGAQNEGTFDLVIHIEDDQSPVIADTTITIENPALPDAIPPFMGAFAGPADLEFPIQGLPDGEYTVHVAIADESANPAEDQITFTVMHAAADTTGGPSDGSTGDGGTSADATDDGPAGTTGDDGPSDESGTTDLGEDQTTVDGCACALDRDASVGFALIPLLGLFARRRRLH
jgi:hypothetical protein